jgi:hypothetical protein
MFHRLIVLSVAALSLIFIPSPDAHAAIGCTLSNPALDLKYVYPDMTSYKEEVYTFSALKEGKQLFSSLEPRLGAAPDSVYDTIETPFTVYTVFRGNERIGIIHGVNMPGKGGVIQLFLAIEPTTRAIKQLFFQRLESSDAKMLRGAAFRNQFSSLTLADWYMHDYYRAKGDDEKDRIFAIKPPEGLSRSGIEDYSTIMRGVRKNLVLLDFFLFERASDQYFQRAQEAIKKIGSN